MMGVWSNPVRGPQGANLLLTQGGDPREQIPWGPQGADILLDQGGDPQAADLLLDQGGNPQGKDPLFA